MKYTIKFFKRHFKAEKKLFIKSFFLLLVSAICGTFYGYLIGLSIDKVRLSSFALALFILFLMFIINLLDNLFFQKYGHIYMEKCANNMMEK